MQLAQNCKTEMQWQNVQLNPNYPRENTMSSNLMELAYEVKQSYQNDGKMTVLHHQQLPWRMSTSETPKGGDDVGEGAGWS